MSLINLTVIEARAEMLSGSLSCAQYVDALLARSSEKSDLNIWITQDTAALRQQARAIDESGLARDGSHPLAGIPLALKDNINTTALPTSGGTRALAGMVPSSNAPVAQALFDAGALLAGKANMHELAFGVTNNNAVTGAAKNPWNPEMIPGGSSGGSAVAVSARAVPAAIGTDTGASVRLPAALCGVAGLRPTVGRCEAGGIIPISHTRDTPGPIARNVADLALLDSVMAQCPDKMRTLQINELRLAVPRHGFYTGMESSVATVVEEALDRLENAGASLIEIDLPELAALNEAVGFPIALFEVMQDLPKYLESSGYSITLTELIEQVGSPDVAGILASQLGDEALPRAVYDLALRTRPQLQAVYAQAFAQHRVDAMIFPTALLPARPIGQDETVELNGEQVPTFSAYIRNTDPGSNAGIPGISLPGGLTNQGLPVGLELDGPASSDRHLLAVAQALETVLPSLTMPE